MNETTEPVVGLPPLDSTCGMAFCPDCQAPLPVTQGCLPTTCPACSRPLRLPRSGMWSALGLAMRQYATFSGRSTRSEYWGFVLSVWVVSILFLLVPVLVGVLLNLVAHDAWLGVAVGVALALVAFCLWGCAILIPSCSICVRRLHDTGRSAWWLISLYIISHMAPFLGDGMEQVSHMMKEHSAFSAPEGQHVEDCLFCQLEQGTLEPAEAVQAFVTLLIPNPSTVCGIAALACQLISLGLGVWIMYLMCVDSQRGQNRYGPSSKYPLG